MAPRIDMEWSRQRLFVVAGLIFAGQLLAIFALHTRQPLRARLPAFKPSPLGHFTTNSVGSEADDFNDPLTFAGAHPLGFSGSAWLKRPRLEISFSNSIPPPRFLAFQRPVSELSETNSFRGQPTPLPFLNISLPEGLPPKSLLIVEGDLSRRALLTNPIPPVQFGSDVLSNSVVKLGVQRDGFPQSLRLIAGSGSPAADLTALQIAKAIRFAPQIQLRAGQEDALQWGQLVFQWHTVAPRTNNPAILPAK